MHRFATAVTSALLLLAASAPATAATGNAPKTVFEHAGRAWAVATVVLGRPLQYRDGKLRAFPSRIVDLMAAARGEPRNVMLVYEVAADEMEKPFFNENDEIFGPIELLPEHSYWRDNLPPTPRHAIAGGRRNVFRGEEIAEARRVLKPYLDAYARKGRERIPGEIAAVAAALDTTVPRLREDAVQFLLARAELGQQFPDAARPAIAGYLAGPAPAPERARLIEAVGKAKFEAIAPNLEALAGGNDEVAVAALAALENMGRPVASERVRSMLESGNEHQRAYAAERIARNAESDPAALQRATALMEPAEPQKVRIAAATGLGASGSKGAVAPLAAAVRRGDSASRAAAMALASIGGEEAGSALKAALLEGKGETAAAAVHGLRVIRGCQDCTRVLAEQHEKHPEQGVRKLIAVALEMPAKHEH